MSSIPPPHRHIFAMLRQNLTPHVDFPGRPSKASSVAIASVAGNPLLLLFRYGSPGLVALFSLGLFLPSGSLAVPPNREILTQVASVPNQTANVIYVSPATGNDNNPGTQQSPFRTLTKAASAAQPNTAIILAPGTYSSATGEQFPILLQPNVTLQGNPTNKGQDILIVGGGWYTSRTSAKQNITILGANGGKISGVTITNPNERGYGLWIESSSLIVTQNTFKGSTHDGISVVGISAPIIQDNLFMGNGANGITIFGNSRPEVRNNDFQNTGFGINIAQNAAPFLIGNRIFDNKDGVVIQANARPVLRDNQIERNQRDGIVAIAQSLPDIGNSREPGRNVIRNNGRYDLNNGTKGQSILAYGNQLSPNKITGAIEVGGSYTPTAVPSPLVSQLVNSQSQSEQPVAVVANDPATMTPINTTSSLPVFIPESNSSTANPINIPVTPPSPPQPIVAANPINIPVTPPSPPQPIAVTNPVNIPVPQPESPRLPPPPPPAPTTSQASAPELLVSLFSRLVFNRPTPVTPSPRSTPQTRPVPSSIPQPLTLPTSISASGTLPVPGPNIPLGSGGGELPNELAYGRGSTLPPLSSTALGLRYRVVVEGNSDGEYRRVRSIIPEAFRTVVAGRQVIQAGAFRDQSRANWVLQQLTRNGLRARIELMN